MQQLGRRLEADARHAGDVIDRIADQRLQIDDLLRLDAPIGQQLVAAKHLTLAQVVHADAIVDQLTAILVAAAQKDFESAARAVGREGGEHVVGLEAGGG